MKKTVIFLLVALGFCVSARAQVSASRGPIFLGVNGVASAPIGIPEKENMLAFGVGLKAGLDFAYPISDNFAIGAYVNAGSGPSFLLDRELKQVSAGALLDVKAGLLMLAGNLNDRPYIIGVTPFTGFGFCGSIDKILPYLPVEVRFGRVLKNNLYITANVNFGVSGVVFMVEPGISFGYNFGPKLKK